MMEGQDQNQDLREKKLRGSGGYVIALISDEEQKKGNIFGVPGLLLSEIYYLKALLMQHLVVHLKIDNEM